MKKKLIEVALPLEAINKESAREKSIRHGHPSTLHLWWSRKPLATCRAVLFSSLVDDPSCHPDKFTTEEAQIEERERLFKLIERLVKWENINDEKLYKEAYEEILKSADGKLLPILDPFAGGGSIPLEAQRLGLEAYASDLNPVAVLINKALIEIPPKFSGSPPVNPESRKKLGKDIEYKGASGLAEDIRYYGEWMREEAFKQVGHLYPKLKLENGKEAIVIAWKWARTVKCSNPACGAEMPLVSGFWLSKKNGKEVWAYPRVNEDNKSVNFEIREGKCEIEEGTVGRKGARCICCGESVSLPYIRGEAKAGRMGTKMMAIVVDGDNGRIYVTPNERHIDMANVKRSDDHPDGILQGKAAVSTPLYGLKNFSDLFTDRQITTLSLFSNLITDVILKVKQDALSIGLQDDNIGIDYGGTGAKAYGEAVGVYLALVIDKETDYSSSLCSWHASRELIRNTFARQAIPMIWDFCEVNLFSNSSGGWKNCLEWIVKCLQTITTSADGYAIPQNAVELDPKKTIVISTDPPYYDNISYADLSDFFYIWLRNSLKDIYPILFSTMQTPKENELIVDPRRHNGNKEKAREFYEFGMSQVFKKMRKTVSNDYPLTVYFAFKQSESPEVDESNIKISSNGWENILQAIINAGFSITGTWPLRTEMMARSVAMNSNALASSIALVCRPRANNAQSITRRTFILELREALKEGIHYLQLGNISPVDLAQASIGPGMAVYSKYSEVLEADGTPMNVCSALILINQELDAYLSSQEGNMDTDSRFCIAWFEQYGLSSGKYGEADTLARAKMAHLDRLVDDGVLEASRGIVRIKNRNELPEKWVASKEDTIWTIVQQLCHNLDKNGLKITAEYMLDLSPYGTTKIENAKSLAYRAYIIADRKGWSEEAFAYNQLVTTWPDLINMMSKLKNNTSSEQLNLFN